MKKLLNRNKFESALFLFLPIFVLLLTASCSRNETYYQFYSVRDSDWHKDSVAFFEVPVTDTLSSYDVFLEIRNSDDYPYQNLWLFVSYQYPSGETRRDTLECLLADDYGKWKGKGLSLYELSVPYDTAMYYPHAGTYTYAVKQGMRDDVLNGIADIGLKVVKRPY